MRAAFAAMPPAAPLLTGPLLAGPLLAGPLLAGPLLAGSLTLTLVLALVMGFSSPARAAFNVCNKSSLKVRVALGRFDGRDWTSMGWWTIQPKGCAGLLTGPLEARYYYLYATDGAAGTWEGRTHFCVAPATRFQVAGRANCAGRGYDRRGFFGVDTGTARDWTQALSN